MIENKEYKDIINKHIPDNNFKSLLLELIHTHNNIYQNNLKKLWINDLINEVKTDLRFRSATTTIEDLDFSKIQIDKIKIQKFEKLSKIIQTEKVIDSK